MPNTLLVMVQKELTAVKSKAAQSAAEHAQALKEAAAKSAEAAQLAQLHTATVQAREYPQYPSATTDQCPLEATNIAGDTPLVIPGATAGYI